MPPIKPTPDPKEPRTGPDANPIVNEQDRPTGGLLDPASQRGLPNPLAEPGPLRTPFPTVDLTEGLQNQTEPDEQDRPRRYLKAAARTRTKISLGFSPMACKNSVHNTKRLIMGARVLLVLPLCLFLVGCGRKTDSEHPTGKTESSPTLTATAPAKPALAKSNPRSLPRRKPRVCRRLEQLSPGRNRLAKPTPPRLPRPGKREKLTDDQVRSATTLLGKGGEVKVVGF